MAIKSEAIRIAGRSGGTTHCGHVRSNNQDEILIDEPRGLWLVADGMGGHAGGGRASALACAGIAGEVRSGASLDAAIRAAHRLICREQQGSPGVLDMGTTVVVLHEFGDEYEFCWVGDSRLYRFDRAAGRLERLTRDQTVPERLLEAGHLTPEQAAAHPHRHVLTDCLGQHGGEPTVECRRGRWGDNEWLLLCSDGLTGEVSDEDLARLLSTRHSVGEAAEALLEAALGAGGRDNVSLILIAPPDRTNHSAGGGTSGPKSKES